MSGSSGSPARRAGTGSIGCRPSWPTRPGGWDLTIEPPYSALRYNFVTPAIRADGTPVVLKALLPDRERETEPAMLAWCEGRGIVRLIEHDPAAGVILIERAEPGSPLLEMDDDDEATRTAAFVMGRIWRPVPARHVFPSVGDWLRGFERHRRTYGGSGPLPKDLFERAEALAPELLASSAEPVVLHGDLHHSNILAAGREPWLAIDPKGVVGEPAYEVGAWLRNRMTNFASAPVIERRIATFAYELGFDRWRIAAWGAVQAVLSAIWSVQMGEPRYEGVLTCAEGLFSLAK